MKTNIKKKLSIALVTIVLLFISLSLYYFTQEKKFNDNAKNVSIIIEYANNKYEYKNISTNAKTLEELLMENNEKLQLDLKIEKSEYGSFITSIKKTSQDKDKGYYYTFLVNNDFALTGISSTPVNDKDVYHFEYKHTTYDSSWNIVSSELVDGGDNSIKESPMPNRIKYAAVFLSLSIAGSILLIAALAYKQKDVKQG